VLVSSYVARLIVEDLGRGRDDAPTEALEVLRRK
jgi:hypothetical protein